MARRRLVILGLSVGFILAGLLILTNQAFVAGQLQPIVGSAVGATSSPIEGFTPYGSLSYVVYAIGIGLIVTGGGLLRSTFHSSLASYAAGGAGMGAMGMTPEAMQSLMESSKAAMTSMAAVNKPAVKIKCQKCGSLEDEDATYCHKCGQKM